MSGTTYALFVLIVLLSGFAQAGSDLCEKFYGPIGFKQKVKVYWSEVKRNPIRRPFLVSEQSADIAPGERLNGFLTPSASLGFSIFRPIVQSLPRYLTRKKYGEAYDVTPFHYLYKNYIHPAVGAASRRLSDSGPYQLTKLSKFLGILTLSISSFMIYDHYTTIKINEQTRAELHASTADYAKLAETDFRFQWVREYKEKTSLTTEEAMIFSAHIRSLQRSYFEYVAENYTRDHEQDFHKTNLSILNDKKWGAVFFRDIALLFRNGIPASSSSFLYSEGFNPQINEKQLDRLVRNRHFALHKFEFIQDVFKNAQNKDDILNHPEIKSYFDTLESQRLLEKILDGWTDPSKKTSVMRKLNVFTHWEERFSNYQDLGIKLVDSKSGSPQVTTPESIYSQIVNNDDFVNQYFNIK